MYNYSQTSSDSLDAFLDFLDKAKELLAHAYSPSPDVQEALHNAINLIDRTITSITPGYPFKICVVGMTNQGKSTLLNALFGEKVVPAKNKAWSSTAVELRYSPNGFYQIKIPSARSILNNQQFSTAQELLQCLNERATEESIMQTDKPLLVLLPNPLLKGDITLVDTPGYGAVVNDIQGKHDAILLNYLKLHKQEIQRMLWIVKGDAIEDSAIQFFNNYLADNCTDLIVNEVEDMTPAERNEYKHRYYASLKNELDFHFVNAKKALKGSEQKEAQLIAESNIREIKDVIRKYATSTARLGTAFSSTAALFQHLHDFIYDYTCSTVKWQVTDMETLLFLARPLNRQELLQSLNYLFNR